MIGGHLGNRVSALLDGQLSAEERQSLAALLRDLYRRTSPEAYQRSPETGAFRL